MKKRYLLATAMMKTMVMTGAAAAPAKHALPTMSAATYDAIMSQIKDCADFQARQASLPSANALLTKLLRQKWPLKGEFESTAEHIQRIKAMVAKLAVNPDRMVVKFSLDATYDADSQVLTVKIPAGYPIAQTETQGWVDNGSWIYGSAAIAKDYTRYYLGIYLPAWQSTEIERKMTPQDAMRLKSSLRISLLGRLVSPYVETDEQTHAPHTIFYGGSIDISTSLPFEAECVAFSDVSQKKAPSVKATPSPPVPSPQRPTPMAPAPVPGPGADIPLWSRVPAGSPVPVVDPTSWFELADWPPAALREGREGSVAYTLNVDVTGQPTACKVKSSSGSDDLDQATCHALMTRAHFRPPLDADGKPIAASFSSETRWHYPY